MANPAKYPIANPIALPIIEPTPGPKKLPTIPPITEPNLPAAAPATIGVTVVIKSNTPRPKVIYCIKVL